MPNDLAIRVENLSKAYRIGLAEQRHETLMGAVTSFIKSPLRNLRDVRNLSRFDDAKSEVRSQKSGVGDPGPVDSVLRPPSSDLFWALKDVSFEVKHGEAIGIIGRNGAGKSTLLKILSRITEPTSGRAMIYGRVASLLEVGTGFHPDLTGRENVYLNGTILGMRKREIDGKFDEIVDFSGVEKFIDTPVKRYSSGMRVRLAFAVAAHLDPEILIIDEVLAVGDAEFQKKCLGKMEDVATQGRTVLFVSHNMAAVQNLCKSVIVLGSGETRFIGNTQSGIEYYLTQSEASASTLGQGNLCGTRPSWAVAYITSARATNSDGADQHAIPLGGDTVIEMQVTCPSGVTINDPVMGVVLNHPLFGAVGGINMRMTGHGNRASASGNFVMRCRLRDLPFLQGRYSIDLWLGDGSRDIDAVMGCLALHIEGTDVYGTGKLPFANLGVAFLKAEWEVAGNPRQSFGGAAKPTASDDHSE